ncbi:hypothetical protein OBBRIDRAFT_425424 [Obba rivulosa]|uniref:Uncharacterized protein n=1 Tax=Obba rivulosa TaxID=1052685 RepID=A0A8E2AIU8_9APHY|nr:hypothetical protein OBBRIDRAFT_425424 [Obba rivulosa]
MTPTSFCSHTSCFMPRFLSPHMPSGVYTAFPFVCACLCYLFVLEFFCESSYNRLYLSPISFILPLHPTPPHHSLSHFTIPSIDIPLSIVYSTSVHARVFTPSSTLPPSMLNFAQASIASTSALIIPYHLSPSPAYLHIYPSIVSSMSHTSQRNAHRCN